MQRERGGGENTEKERGEKEKEEGEIKETPSGARLAQVFKM